jgi:hypothetical protein
LFYPTNPVHDRFVSMFHPKNHVQSMPDSYC